MPCWCPYPYPVALTYPAGGGGWILNCQHQHFFVWRLSPVTEACLWACHQVISTRELTLPSTSGKLCMYLLHRLTSPPAGFCSRGPQWYLHDKLLIAAFFPIPFSCPYSPTGVSWDHPPNKLCANSFLRFCFGGSQIKISHFTKSKKAKQKHNKKNPESPRGCRR